MKYLLDSHILIWALFADEKLHMKPMWLSMIRTMRFITALLLFGKLESNIANLRKRYRFPASC